MNKVIMDERGAVFVNDAGKEVRIISWEHLRDYSFTDDFEEWVNG